MLIAQVAQVIMSNRTNHVARNWLISKVSGPMCTFPANEKVLFFTERSNLNSFSLPVVIYKQVLGQGEQVLVSLWTEQMPF